MPDSPTEDRRLPALDPTSSWRERVRIAMESAALHTGRPPPIAQIVDEQVRRMHQLSLDWEEQFLAHRTHPTFYMFDNVWTRQIGFICCCTGVARQHPLGIAGMRDLAPDTRAAVGELPRVGLQLPHRVRRGGVSRRRQLGTRLRASQIHKTERQAFARARALLHQLLTREQRWQLRGTGTFRVDGQDGRVYEITPEAVLRLEDGRATVSYCIHPRERLPVYDVMLAQKLLLQSDTERFLTTANARPIVTTAVLANAARR